jgi:excisionase family DNA binding protein
VPEKLVVDPPPPRIIEGRERLLTKEGLSDYLQCTTAYISREVRAGRLKAITLAPNEIRFRWSDVDAWLKDREGLV